MAWPEIPDPLARLKILLESSTPIVAFESVEEVRAVRLVRAACAALNLATFEWTIASGLVRCGSDVGEVVPKRGQLVHRLMAQPLRRPSLTRKPSTTVRNQRK